MGRLRAASSSSSVDRPRSRVEVAVSGCGGNGRLLTLVGLGDEKCEAIGEHLASLFCLETNDLSDGVRRQSTVVPHQNFRTRLPRTSRRAAQWMVRTRFASSPCSRRDARGSQPRETSSISTRFRKSNLSPLTTFAVFFVFHWMWFSSVSKRKMRGALRPLRLYLNAAKPRCFIVCLNSRTKRSADSVT